MWGPNLEEGYKEIFPKTNRTILDLLECLGQKKLRFIEKIPWTNYSPTVKKLASSDLDRGFSCVLLKAKQMSFQSKNVVYEKM